MARMGCGICNEYEAVMMLQNLDSGDVTGLCPDCAPRALRALADQIDPPQAGDVDAGDVDTAAQAGDVDTAAQAGDVDATADTGDVDATADTGDVDTAAQAGDVDTTADTGDVDATADVTPVPAGDVFPY